MVFFPKFQLEILLPSACLIRNAIKHPVNLAIPKAKQTKIAAAESILTDTRRSLQAHYKTLDKAMTMTTKVALIGLGILGQRMPTHMPRHQNFGSAGGFTIGVVLIYVSMPNFCMTTSNCYC